MRVLLTGGTGFAGRRIASALVAAGHEVVGCSRRRSEALRRYPELGWIRVDFAVDRTVDAWRPRLTGFDLVINAAGVVRERAGQSFDAVNFEAPRALFLACAERGLRKVIQISAPGCERDARPYAASKLRTERFLAGLDLDSIIVRASLAHAGELASTIVDLVGQRVPGPALLELDAHAVQ